MSSRTIGRAREPEDQPRAVLFNRAMLARSYLLSVEPKQRRAFAVQVLLYRPAGGTTGTGETAVRP